MNHFAVWPSAIVARAIDCAKAWKAKGYSICVGLDERCHKDLPEEIPFDAIKWFPEFRGYYVEIHSLVGMAFHAGADLVSVIGDDMLPPDQGADVIAALYFERFPSGFGVLQGTGDTQGERIGGKWNSQRICGSPTFGRAWHDRAYPTPGGFPTGYRSFYGDEQLLIDAQAKGVLWQEESIKIDHVHWAFGRAMKQPYHETAQKNWDVDRALFEARKAVGFREQVNV